MAVTLSALRWLLAVSRLLGEGCPVTYATLDDLRSHLGGVPRHSPEYAAKMLHPLPSGAIVQREAFVIERCIGRRILEFGATGHLHEELMKVATVFGVDRIAAPCVVAFDLDDITQTQLPDAGRVDLIVCGETLEHLANPGWFLHRVKAQWPGVPMILTVPNAFCAVGAKQLRAGFENVNIDHVAWYSPRTLRTLLERYGFAITAFAYYNGDGPTAEGLIAVVES